MRDYWQSLLSLRWRRWMTERYVGAYLKDRTFYRIASEGVVDNPDQRINADIGAFTGTALGFVLTLFNSAIDLASFSGILFSIYTPLFFVLVVYALGGTAVSVALGQKLVGLNFAQEAREADFRHGGICACLRFCAHRLMLPRTAGMRWCACARTRRVSPSTAARRRSARCCARASMQRWQTSKTFCSRRATSPSSHHPTASSSHSCPRLLWRRSTSGACCARGMTGNQRSTF
jgi:hypothetical protein